MTAQTSTQMETNKSIETPVKSGESSVKSGESSVKSGESSVKSGESSVKSSESSVKSVESSVKSGGSFVKLGGSFVKLGGSSSGRSDESSQNSRRSSDFRRKDDISNIRRNSGTSLRRCSFCSEDKEMEHTEFCPRCICIRTDGVCSHEDRHTIRTCSGCDLTFQDLSNGEEKLLI